MGGRKRGAELLGCLEKWRGYMERGKGGTIYKIIYKKQATIYAAGLVTLAVALHVLRDPNTQPYTDN